MYLMNVPPVAAVHPEWRSCGPPRGYSLPLCFHDSDSELSTTGTPIPEKVQMIIESLRGTQSSLDMGDEIEGNLLSRQETHPQACKAQTGPVVGPESKSQGPTESRQPDVSSPINSESQDSDSDDSVDRGIEEAILEYLKEKDSNKRKVESTTNILQPCKIPRKDPPVPEISKQHSDSNKVLTASIHVPKSVKAENHTAPAFPATKNPLKSKPPFKENPVKKTDTSKGTTTKSIISLNNQKKNTLVNKIKCPVAVKVEEDTSESSSDDGIEEAIQRYQLEKKEEEQNISREAFKPLTFKEEPESSSDDGIEEAIRSYQLEQLKEKSVLKPSLPKQKPVSKLPVCPVEGTSTEHVKKNKLTRKKNKITENEVKSLPPPPSPVCILKSRLPDSPKGKGNGVISSKVETLREQHTQATLKVNTTAELMCAEAILDISKAVMPEVFNPNVGLVSCSPAQLSSALITCPNDKSDDSSIDSEDGIEQEIMKFLEQKAQILKQPPDSAATTTAPRSLNELDEVKSKQCVSQKKVQRLSLTQKRKQREEDCKQISKEPVTDQKIKEDAPLKSLPELEKGSSPSVSPLRITPQPSAGLGKTEQSADKSSSLDSDEDLDMAIKDLLKTKKKSKKKTRDMKLKSRRCLKDAEPLSGNTLQTKKLKLDPISKGSVSKEIIKSKDDITEKSKFSKKSVSLSKQSNKRKEPSIQANETDKSKGHGGVNTPSLDNSLTIVRIKEDSSSVDSDDSIELEIRKFLAEKAKVSTTEKTGDVPGNAIVKVCKPIPDTDIRLENQLAEIPREDITPLPDRSLAAGHESKPSQDEEALPTTHTALPDTPTTVIIPCLSSALSNSPSPLEPADGAGAVRTVIKRPSTGIGDYHNVTSEMVRPRPLMSPSVAQSRSDSIKWRQSLGLPTTVARGVSLSLTPFHVSSPKISETASTTPVHQRGSTDPKPQTPATACPSSRSSGLLSPFHRSPERPALSRSPYSTLSTARQPPARYFMQGIAAGAHWAQHPMSERTESVVHMAKDQCTFVELASNKINHVQVRSKEMSEGKDTRDLPSEKGREGESMEPDKKGMELGGEEDNCVDETDCESNERRSPVKKQGFSTLSLSSAIHHGITLSPYIALDTEERRMRFNRMYMAVNRQKAKASLSGGAHVQNKPVKRKLRFLPVSRRNEQAVL